ncbi:MAG: hypothetical protein QOH71_2632 [Blastocatellia bacterium]|jgi:hypothetical protein|nr:hypothetical protein [Blastocatellia bacterium]
MNRSRCSIIICAALILLPRLAPAQSPTTKPKTAIDNTEAGDKSGSKAEARTTQRRTQARSLLISLASDARGFRDQPLRARSLARIADTLWDVDADQGRTLFRQAWEAAETGDRESQEPLKLRKQVLTLVAKHDRHLAEEFLDKIKIDQKDDEAGNSKPDLWGLSDASQQRLNLAESLLREGSTERALQFADSVLNSVTISTVEFLTLLREKNAAPADQRYAALLANTSRNMTADANTVSLLSSYIFTPHMYVIFNIEGSASSGVPPSFYPMASVEPQLRLAFFQTAAAVLLRPQAPPEQDRSTSGIAGAYMVVKRLLPLFEQYAPREMTEAMRSQLEALNSLVSEDLRHGESEWTEKGITPEPSFADQERSLLNQIEHTRTSDERDELYFKLALLAVGKADPKANDYVSKISESEARKRAQAWIDWCLAIVVVKQRSVEKALELARKGELTHIQRVWVLTQSAKLLVKTDQDKASSLLDDATAETRRMDGADLDRPRALLAIANALEPIDAARAWDAIFDVVKAANSTEGFSGEDGVLTVTIRTKNQAIRKMEANPDFQISGIFGELATSDFNRAIESARGFQGEAPRANATIAICRSVLNEKSNSFLTSPPMGVKSTESRVVPF